MLILSSSCAHGNKPCNMHCSSRLATQGYISAVAVLLSSAALPCSAVYAQLTQCKLLCTCPRSTYQTNPPSNAIRVLNFFAGVLWFSGELEGERQKTCQYVRPQTVPYTEDTDDTSYVHHGLACASQQMLHEDLFTDAVLMVEGQGIAVHRAVLAANSPVFKNMFKSQMREGKSTCMYLCLVMVSHLVIKKMVVLRFLSLHAGTTAASIQCFTPECLVLLLSLCLYPVSLLYHHCNRGLVLPSHPGILQ